ncbi:hypothetical protein C834K_0585 [Chlamydia poikilotherma]|uniref:DUF1266 domain-containing protein n=1 Tax=Chlamydia poikilotherma TaxID=1967783 RepID=A0A3B0PMP6_9CHLA|nr:hypothetical protein [Chlamydia poikilotherma]SYX09039.1 hypothetical protein C834K_0585 [Chlamydia poikilotherma]
MPNLNKLLNCLSLTQNIELTQRNSCPKAVKTSVLVGLLALSIIFIMLGALALAGSASLGLLIFGSVCISFLVLGFILGKLIKKTPTSIPFSRSEIIQPPLNAQGEAALAYAKSQLDTERGRIEIGDWSDLRPPINNDISYLIELRSEKYQAVLNLLGVDASGELTFPSLEAVSDPIFTRTVTELLQLSFAISLYSLRDLDSYKQRYDVSSNLEALARQNSAYYKTFYMMSRAYSLIRHLDMHCAGDISPDLIEARVSRFYQEGTVENDWRFIYNCFCEQARWYLGNEEEAYERECRLIKHSRADLNRRFGHAGTTPT